MGLRRRVADALIGGVRAWGVAGIRTMVHDRGVGIAPGALSNKLAAIGPEFTGPLVGKGVSRWALREFFVERLETSTAIERFCVNSSAVTSGRIKGMG